MSTSHVVHEQNTMLTYNNISTVGHRCIALSFTYFPADKHKTQFNKTAEDTNYRTEGKWECFCTDWNTLNGSTDQ